MELMNQRLDGFSAEMILQLEQKVLNGQCVEDLIGRTPGNRLQSSPLLLKEKGELLFREGRMTEAQTVLETAVKGLTACAMQEQMLSALALLARVHCRTGQIHSAVTLLQFLKNEGREQPGVRNGHLEWALAQGCHLLGESEYAWYHYARASDFFEEQGDWKRTAAVYAEKLFKQYFQVNGSDWISGLHRLDRAVSFHPASESLSHLLRALDFYAREQWEQANQRLDACLAIVPEEYLWRRLALEMKRQLMILTGHEEADETGTPITGNSSDLEAEYAVEITRYLRSLVKRDHAGATLSEAKLNSLGMMLPHPVYRGLVTKIKEWGRRLQIPPEAKPTWRISLFGGLAFERGTQERQRLSWKRKKSLELFLLLLTRPRHAIPRDWALDVLLGESDSKNALNQLYVTVHQLKKVLQEQLDVEHGVQLQEGTIRLRDDWMEMVDTEQYLALVRLGDQMWVEERNIAAELYERAAAMYSPVLPEMPYLDWLETYRLLLVENQARILHRLCLHNSEAGLWEKTVYFSSLWTEANPLQEEAYQMLLTALMKLGRKAEALDWYEKWETLCRKELETEPQAETLRIVMR